MPYLKVTLTLNFQDRNSSRIINRQSTFVYIILRLSTYLFISLILIILTVIMSDPSHTHDDQPKDPKFVQKEADLKEHPTLKLNRGGEIKEVDAASLRKPHARSFGRSFQLPDEGQERNNAGGLLRNDGHRPGK
ncbi:hypothetical protein ZYGR_0AG03290 [Zygosaccharomyces rouxii]|uniref:Uncharacterized protein n=1 Tax=Zygosaccharomyces rouxii TaxID=4956 RepID=A0A1Q3A9H8_ZYGRO|nr:hypothetical protein ZYGR_0AG03290 [Zygosaccharomyces rouxii]